MEFLKKVKEEISKENPIGNDIRYDDDFELIQDEIKKLQVAPIGELGPNWENILNLGGKILEEKSKDLLVVSYTIAALLNVKKAEGIISGLNYLNGFITNFWNKDIYPKSPKAKLSALNWIINFSSKYISKFPIGSLSDSNIKKIASIIEKLKKTFDKTVKNENIVFSSLNEQKKKLEDFLKEKERKKLEQQKTKGDIPTQISSEKDAEKSLKFVLKQLNFIATFSRNKDLQDIKSYQLNRISAWMDINELPLLDDPDDKVSKLNPPDQNIKAYLEQTFLDQDYEAVIKSAESHIQNYLFWLDLNYFTAMSLKEMGSEYMACYDVVVTETLNYIKRLPGIEKIKFADGTPFADVETLNWLDDLNITANPSKEQNSIEQEIEETYSKSLDFLKKKKKKEAIELLQNKIDESSSIKDKSLWRLALIKFLMRIDKNMLLPHIELVINDINKFQIYKWDKNFALNNLKFIYQALIKEGSEEAKKQAKLIISKINILSPLDAMKIKG